MELLDSLEAISRIAPEQILKEIHQERRLFPDFREQLTE